MMLAGAAACGGDATGPTFPNVRGTYATTWTFTLTEVSGSALESLSCLGTITITSQSGGSFSGSFIVQQSTDCETESGTVSGEVRGDGDVNLTLGVPGAGPNAFLAPTVCTVTNADSQYDGTLVGNQLSVTADATLSCFGFVNVRLTGRIDALRA